MNATRLSDLPQGEHWAIIEEGSIYVPGDERSRTHPGHGYPGGNEPVLKYTAFKTEEAFLRAMTTRLLSPWKSPFRGIHVTAEQYVSEVIVKKG